MYLMASAVLSCGFTWTCVLTTSAGWVMREARTPAKTPQLKLASGAQGEELISVRTTDMRTKNFKRKRRALCGVFYLLAARLSSGCRTWRRSRRTVRLWAESPSGRRTERQDLRSDRRCAGHRLRCHNCTCHTDTPRGHEGENGSTRFCWFNFTFKYPSMTANVTKALSNPFYFFPPKSVFSFLGKLFFTV